MPPRSHRNHLLPLTHVAGGYAEYAVVPEAFAYRIPDAFSDIEATPLLCAGIHMSPVPALEYERQQRHRRGSA